MRNIYEIPETALCNDCGELKFGDEFSKAHFLTYKNQPPVCKECIGKRRFKHNHKSLETKLENEGLMKDHIFTILGYDLNRDIHEQFLERHPELTKK
jgi:hypothetical protein